MRNQAIDILRSAAAACAAAVLLGVAGQAAASESGLFTFDEENDFFTFDNRDRHYTQGASLDYLSPDLAAGGIAAAPMEWMRGFLPIFEGGASSSSRHFDLFASQELFTPENKTLQNPDPRDRPYAGWLNGGVSFIEDDDQRRLDHVELQLGTIGRNSLAKQTQNNFHLAIDNPESQGWGYQLRNEPTVDLYFDRHLRYSADLGDGLDADLIPAAGIAVGNAFDYLEAGARVRIGQNLKVDYGPPRIAPGPSGTSYFNRDYITTASLWGWYVFAGSDGRAVARNIFLDGNSFESSRRVPKRPLVGDLESGVAVFYSDYLRLSYSYLYRSDEFYGQHNGDNYGAIMISLRAPF